MNTVGLLGGMSWESTVPYYRLINQRIKERLGGLHSARIVLYSVDFHDIERLQHVGDWDAAGLMLARAARALELAGADFIVLCTNTMHKVAPAIELATTLPLLHIADPTARQIRSDGHTKVGLIGTLFTMEQSFYSERLQQQGLTVITPPAHDSAAVHRIIYEELCLGQVLTESRATYQRVMTGLAERGAQAIILGCTEISLLIGPSDAVVPIYDTTSIHALAAADEALGMR